MSFFWAKSLKRIGRYAQQFTPTPEKLARYSLLRPYAQQLGRTELWFPRHESVARGVAFGLFWAFVFPVAQIVFAVFCAILMRGNIPASIFSTMITNPFNFPFWWWLAYQLGSKVLGDSAPYKDPEATGMSLSWMLAHGTPVLIGMLIFAVVFSTLGYFLVKGVWRIQVALRRSRRKQKRAVI